MVRPKKPEEELTKAGKYLRKLYAEHPEKRTDAIKWHKKYYLKNKQRIQIRKKLKTKKQREELIQILGSKCKSCGEAYNPHLRRSNLEFDHLFYLKSKDIPTHTVEQIFIMMKKGVDPSIQFALLCHKCHMIITYVRKYPDKLNYVFNYMKNNKILPT